MITSDEDISVGEVKAELSDRHVDSICFLCKGSPVQLASSKKSTDVQDSDKWGFGLLKGGL